MSRRTFWYAPDLGIKNEPLLKSLIEYRQDKNRRRTSARESPNLIASITTDGKQMPILDLDFPHHYEESTTDGHSHLYIDTPQGASFRQRWSVWLLHVTWNWVLRGRMRR